MRKFFLRLLPVGGLFIVALYLINASWLAAPPVNAKVRLIAHRGLHQNFDFAGVSNDTCTATRIRAPIAPEIENTIASIRAAFAAGADVVEIDVHPTTDGKFAVFHDWTLDCRTNGKGLTRAHSMTYLKTLDVGYGYTADGGKTFPLRGHGVGMMPTLNEVLRAFPRRRFLINYKSKDMREGDLLAALLRAHPEWRDEIWGVYGDDAPTGRTIGLIKGLKGYSLSSIKRCLFPYVVLGWSGYMPNGCRETILPLPINLAPWLWGWPRRFEARMAAAESIIVLFGPYERGDAGSSGIDGREQVELIPIGFDGYVSTNRIDSVRPLLTAP